MNILYKEERTKVFGSLGVHPVRVSTVNRHTSSGQSRIVLYGTITERVRLFSFEFFKNNIHLIRSDGKSTIFDFHFLVLRVLLPVLKPY